MPTLHPPPSTSTLDPRRPGLGHQRQVQFDNPETRSQPWWQACRRDWPGLAPSPVLRDTPLARPAPARRSNTAQRNATQRHETTTDTAWATREISHRRTYVASCCQPCLPISCRRTCLACHTHQGTPTAGRFSMVHDNLHLSHKPQRDSSPVRSPTASHPARQDATLKSTHGCRSDTSGSQEGMRRAAISALGHGCV